VYHAIWAQNISYPQCRITDYKGRASKEHCESASELKKESFRGEEFSVVRDIQHECLGNVFHHCSISPSPTRRQRILRSPFCIGDCHLSPIGNDAACERSSSIIWPGTQRYTYQAFPIDLRKACIRVNSISPGYFPCEMTVKTKEPKSDENQKSQFDLQKTENCRHVAAKRAETSEEMA